MIFVYIVFSLSLAGFFLVSCGWNAKNIFVKLILSAILLALSFGSIGYASHDRSETVGEAQEVAIIEGGEDDLRLYYDSQEDAYFVLSESALDPFEVYERKYVDYETAETYMEAYGAMQELIASEKS